MVNIFSYINVSKENLNEVDWALYLSTIHLNKTYIHEPLITSIEISMAKGHGLNDSKICFFIITEGEIANN